MARYLVFGNSGSGKSTLAARLSRQEGIPHLDLDTLAWRPEQPPVRRALDESARDIASFMDANDAWIIEGCYADLIAVSMPRCTLLLFLNPGVEACVANARLRPWEPHRYPTKALQDASLEMLVGWIGDYASRRDVFALAAHRALFDGFPGERIELTSNETVAAFRAHSRKSDLAAPGPDGRDA